MKDKKWKPKQWQGRSQKQVESNYKVMAYGCALMLVALIVGGLVNTILNVLG